MATRPKAVIESRNGEEFSPITIAKNVLTDDGQNLYDILSDRKEDMMSPTIENSSSMFKVGQGDNVDYSENVVDGAYESCVLKGVTKFIDNNTGETLDSFVENRDLSLIDCKSPILSNVGKNLFEDNVAIQGYHNESDTFYNDSNFITYKNPISVVPNTEYIFGNNIQTRYGRINFYDKNMKIISSITDQNLSPFTTPSNCHFVRFSTYRNTGIKPSEIIWSQLEVGRIATPYEPYKTNILSCNGDKIELTEDMFEQGGVYYTEGQSFANATNNTDTARIRLKTLLNLKPNTTYRITIDDAHKVGVQIYNSEKIGVGDTGWVSDATITTKDGENAIALVVRNLSSTTKLSVSDFKNIKLQLSEVDKTIVLRSLPNGVCDTLNVETGEYVQRIGEVVLNGSNDETFVVKGGWINDTHMSFDFKVSDAVKEKTNVITVISDKFKSVIRNSQSASSTDEFITNTSSGFIFVMIRKNRLNTQDLVGFKQWLSQNTLTVQYELATPVIKTVDLSGYPFAYKDGHVQLSSGSIEQSLTPKIEYSVITNRNGQIRSNQKMIERQQKQLDRLQAMVLANLVNTQYEQTLTNLKYDLKNVREEVK